MKKKILLASILAMVICLCCGILAACGTTFKIEWSSGENYTITADGYDKLPTEVKEGTEITFTVTPKDGYEIEKVKNADPSGDKYKFTVNKDIKIEVTVKESIESINVTGVTKLTYFAGETLDTTDMKVTAKYKTGTEKEVTTYSVVYQNGAAFALGDTKCTVSFSGATKEITLTTAVVGKITINTVGGSIDSTAVEAWKDFAGFTNENGVVSWTFTKALETDITLPAADKVTKGNPGDFDFISWNGEGVKETDGVYTIPANTAVSVTATAKYDPHLVVLESVSIKEHEVTLEGGTTENAPCLVVTGKFKAAEKIYLYLYEGNDKVELKGTQVEGTSGETFTIVFDVRDLVAKNYKGKWMDIKFCAELGEYVETQEINLNNYPDNFINLDDTVEFKVGESWYQANFKVHTPDNTTDRNLKLQYVDYTNVGYKFTSVSLDERDVTLTVPGEGDAEPTTTVSNEVCLVIAGKYTGEKTDKAEVKAFMEEVHFDINELLVYNDVMSAKEVTVNDDLTFEIVFSLDKLEATSHPYFMHVGSGSDNNLTFTPVASTIVKGDMQYKLGKCPTNFAGYAGWMSGLTTITVSSPNAAVQIDKVNNDQQAFDAKGQWTYGIMNAAAQAGTAIGKHEINDGEITITFKNLSNTAAGGNTSRFYYMSDMPEGTQLKVTLTVKMNVNGSLELSCAASGSHELTADVAKTITIDYTVGAEKGNGPIRFCPIVAEADNAEVTLVISNISFESAAKGKVTVAGKSVMLTKEDDKAIYTVNGTYELEEGAEFAAGTIQAFLNGVAADFQRNPYAVTGAWDGDGNDWTTTAITVVSVTFDAEAKTFAIKYDVTDLKAYKYTGHFNGGDFKPAESYESEVITIGNKTYKIEVVAGSDDGAKYWGNVGLIITEAE